MMKGADSGHIPLAVPMLLSLIAGYVDSCTFLALFGLFVAQATGSFVMTGTQLVTHADNMLIKALAIPVFFFAGMLTTIVAAATNRCRYGALPWTLALEEVLLAAFVGVGITGSPFFDASAPMAVAAALFGLSAMGVQSTLVRLLMPGFGSTNVMTNNTTQLAISLTRAMLAWRKRHPAPDDSATVSEYSATCRQLIEVLLLVIGFLFGTVAGSVAYLQFGLWCALAPMFLLGGLITWSLWSERPRSVPGSELR
jgi:uncharacterized membrane protein YoaK (UPF0700 family)